MTDPGCWYIYLHLPNKYQPAPWIGKYTTSSKDRSDPIRSLGFLFGDLRSP